MGMFSEISASCEAKTLLKAIKCAIETKNSDVAIYCEKIIVPLFKSAKGEAWEDFTEEETQVLKELSELA